MSNRRKIKGIPYITMPKEEYSKEQERVNKAEFLTLPSIKSTDETGNIVNVKRVVQFFLENKTPIFYIETTDGTIFKLPTSLYGWADNTIHLVLGLGGNDVVKVFPTEIEFGIINGRAYAEMLD